jgi:hypothetical protein
VKLDPRLRKLFRFGLIGSGALAVMSGVVNIIAAYQLIDQSEGDSLGVSRDEFIVTYAGFIVVGVVLIFFGWRIKTPTKP